MTTNNNIHFESIEVLPVKSEKVDISNMDYIRGNESTKFPNITFLVKLKISGEIPSDSLGMDLLFDDYTVRKYSQCNKGVFFKVYNPRFLTKHSGKEIYFTIGGNEKQATGIKFPEIPNQTAIDNLIESTPEIPLAENVIN